MRKSTLIIALFLGSIVIISFESCKKKLIEESSSENKILNKKVDKNLVKFLSITLGTTMDKVKYDETNQEFIVNGWFRKKLEDVQKEYNMSNEYKANYEN